MGDDQQKCGFLLKVCGVVMKGVDKWVTISRIAVSFRKLARPWQQEVAGQLTMMTLFF